MQYSQLVLALGLTACLGNHTGRITADKSGDTSHPAEQGSPIDELRAACGAGTTAATTIHRQPYLQQVTQSSAMIGWVSLAPDSEVVAVTTADKTPIASLAAEPETAVVRTAGEHQMWARITGLSPDTIYCYQLSDGTQALSEPTGFRTAPAADDSKPVRFVAFGDSGGGGGDQYALLDQMFKFPYQLMIHTGDIAYDHGSIGQFEDNVFGVYAELFKNVPFFPAAGNHEYETQGAAPFRDVFALPGDSGEKWYSYDWGRVHFAALDTEADYATQAAWLDQDLAASPLPWKIVYFHRPPYSSGGHGSDTTLRAYFSAVFERNHVQLVLAGHDHDYERMIPQGGVEYVVTGGGGKGTRSVGTSSFTAFSDEVIHFVYVEVNADDLVLHAIDGTGKEFDSVVIAR